MNKIELVRDFAEKTALEVLIDENLIERSHEMGEYFMGRLRRLESDIIKEVRGKGLLIGMELTKPARPYAYELKAKGVLAKETHDNVIRFAPPLVITKDEIDWAMGHIEAVFV